MLTYYLVMSYHNDGTPAIKHKITEEHARTHIKAGTRGIITEQERTPDNEDDSLFGW